MSAACLLSAVFAERVCLSVCLSVCLAGWLAGCVPVSSTDRDFSLHCCFYTGSWSVVEIRVKATGHVVEHVIPI
jgi:hypothetical protein